MTIKNWTHDGPRQSSQPYAWHWSFYQGKAYPNPVPGQADRDQAGFDQDRAQYFCTVEINRERDERELRQRMEKRRREKTGRGY
jgi:hypothetical protein